MQKGETKQLNVTKEAQHRVVVGLGWDPAAQAGLLDKVQAMAKGKNLHHDLDLSCFAYDEYKAFVGQVSAVPELATMANEKIYHSGDNEEGVGEGDDEEISVELKDLPINFVHLFFTATVTSGQTFGVVNSPEMRIADGYTDHNFLQTDLNAPQAKDSNLYLFVKLSRGENDNWSLTFLDEYKQDSEINDYEAFLRTYL